MASASLVSDHVMLFGSGRGKITLLVLKNTTDWDKMVDTLGVQSKEKQAMKISTTREKIEAIRDL